MQTPSLSVPLIGITGKKNSGKTTLIEGLIRRLTAGGLKVCTIKHHHHGDFEIDVTGKDSYRHYEAGASGVIISSARKTGYFERVEEGSDSIEALVSRFPKDTGLILMEGFHRSPLPRIEVSRKALSTELISDRGTPLIAVAADYKPDVQVPIFDINAYDEMSGFIMSYINNE